MVDPSCAREELGTTIGDTRVHYAPRNAFITPTLSTENPTDNITLNNTTVTCTQSHDLGMGLFHLLVFT